jgi:PAS domain S-box-containing protein
MNVFWKTHAAGPVTLATDTGRGRIGFERRIQLGALLAGLPAIVLSMALLWGLEFSLNTRLTLTIPILLWWVAVSAALRETVAYPLRTLSNLLGALYEGDYSLRGAAGRRDDVLGEVIREFNSLSELLRSQRVGTREAQALLGKVLAEIDVAVFAFDADGQLQLINRGGERLLGRAADQVLGHRAEELGLSELFQGSTDRVVSLTLTGRPERWKLHRGRYREGGQSHQLILLTDLTRELHSEERAAWQRLIRILRHEINNSLAPIHSLAGSLRAQLGAAQRPTDWEEDLRQGLAVIENRAESLHRFIHAYSTVTRLPDPRFAPVEVGECVRRIAGLESRAHVGIAAGPPLTIQADGAQLDQMLINLVRNAVDATLPKSGCVEIGWEVCDARLRLWVEDDGPGLADPEQAFTPFYTTKPEGSGVGLPLSRQIAENHGGTLSLGPSPAGGCRALVELPIN